MPVSINGNKAVLSVKGFRKVNEFISPELLDESELTVLKNYTLDEVSGVPTLRHPLQSYNANALSGASPSMMDVLIGSTDYILAVDGTTFKKSSAGTGAWSDVKTSLTSSKIMRICQWSGKLYCVNGFDPPFQTDLTTTANLALAKPDVSSTTVTPSTSGGSIVAGEYLYTIVYQDSNGNVSPPSHTLHATVAGTTAGSVAFASLPTTYTKYLYRTQVNSGTFYLAAVIGDTTTAYTDTLVDTDLDLSNTLSYITVPTSAFYPIIKNDRLILGNVKITPYNFPTFYSNTDLVFPNFQDSVGSDGLTVSSTYKWKIALVFSDGSESEASYEITHVTGASMGGDGTLFVSMTFLFPLQFSNVTGMKFYRTTAGGSTFYYDYTTVAVNPVSRASGVVQYTSAVSDVDLVLNDPLTSPSATTYGSRIVWSENAKPSTIGALNFLDVYPDDGDVITGLVDDGDGILVFKTNNIYKLYTNGPPENWSVYKVLNGKGCSDPNTLVASPRGIFFNYRGHIYKWGGPNSAPEDVGLEYLTTLATVSSYHVGFYHAKDEWIAFPVVISSTDRLLVYDTKLNTWYNFSTGGTASAFAAFSRQYGSDAGKMVLSVTTTLGWYTEPTGTAGIDTYPTSAAISGQIRTKTFTFPDGVPLVRPRFLWLNALVITSFSITHTLSDPDAGASATVAQAATQTGVVRYITDAMTSALKTAGKLYYDMTGTYMTKFYGFEFTGTILNRARRAV